MKHRISLLNQAFACIVAAIALILLTLLSGCTAETAPKETNMLKLNPITGNYITQSHNFDGEAFQIITKYDIGDYDFRNWRITDSKVITLSAKAENVPSGTTIFIEHVHADVSLQSTKPQVDGLTQDSFDDSYHGNHQEGFYIDEKYGYESKFAIEGFSQDLINGWSFVTSSVGDDGISRYDKLTENNLINGGKVYANKLSVIYDVLIRNEGEEYYHTKSFVDEFLIPIPEEIENPSAG